MEQERINIIYEVLIYESELTTNTLRKYGLKDEEIETLISNRIIEPINYRTFQLVSAEKMRQYGVKLLLTGHKLKSQKCFEKCYELAPNGKNIVLQYMLSKVATKNYKEAFELYMQLEKIHPEKNERDHKLYLFLLSIVTNYIPNELKEKMKNLNPEEIILPYCIGNKVENEIRTNLSQHKFKYAYKLINDRNQKETEYSVKYDLMRILTIQAIGVDKKVKNDILYLTRHEQYKKIISFLSNIQNQRQLSKMEFSILKTCQAITNLFDEKALPKVDYTDTEDIYIAIENNNFKLAQALNKEFLEYAKIDPKENVMYLLLTKINQLICEIHMAEEAIEEAKEEENIKTEQTIITNSLSECELEEIEELAYYISSQNMSVNQAKKKIGLLTEQILLVKLIYVRDYYIESNFEIGDNIIKEVELSLNITPKVISFLEEIKRKKYEYKNEFKQNKRSLIKK